MAYAGGTSIIIPKPLTPYVGLTVLELGMCVTAKAENRLKPHIYIYLLCGGRVTSFLLLYTTRRLLGKSKGIGAYQIAL